MNYFKGQSLSIVLLVSLGNMTSTSVNAATPSDLSDLVGARASGGETQLINRGYKFINTEKGTDRSWSNWYKERNNTCVSVVTFDGRYNSITETPTVDCNQTAKSKENHTVAIAAAAVALGAIAAVAVHEHDKDKKHDQNSSVSNDINDLVGARASSAETTLESRGYYNVKGNSGRYSKENLWWNPQKKECLGVATYDGRIDSINKLSASECDDSSSNYGSQSYSPAADITCFQSQRTCYRYGQGVDKYWTNREF